MAAGGGSSTGRAERPLPPPLRREAVCGKPAPLPRVAGVMHGDDAREPRRDCCGRASAALVTARQAGAPPEHAKRDRDTPPLLGGGRDCNIVPSAQVSATQRILVTQRSKNTF